ncbi:UTRA domain-containing protein [Vibrio sp. TRT 17S01]|uniref:UTRA domain-containing protein n=1 Tax=Vibrio sp. TRT 17S01 TaxID=3418505 RepID=UPI003CE67515
MQYIKIKESIEEQIEAGMLAAGQKLPSERKLAESFDTTRVTLREALSLLEAEGRLYREDRRGWFISPPPLKYNPLNADGFVDIAKQQGRTPSNQIVVAKSVIADKTAARLLQLPPFSDVYRIDSLHLLNDRPVAYVTRYIRSDGLPNLLDQDLTSSFHTLYREQFGIELVKSQYRIATSSLLGDEASSLRATLGTPSMVIERVNKDKNGNIIDCEIMQWRHDAICIEAEVVISE